MIKQFTLETRLSLDNNITKYLTNYISRYNQISRKMWRVVKLNNFNENAEKYVRGVVQSFQEEHNVNSEMIFVGGNSLGGQGALYMAEHVDDVFSKAFVMSAYADEIGRYDVNNITIPTIGYVGKSNDFKTSDSGYMDSQFANAFGDENLVRINRAHGKVPINAFRLDADGDGKSDLIEWLLEDQALPENSDEY